MPAAEKKYGWFCIPCRDGTPRDDLDGISEERMKLEIEQHLLDHKGRVLTDPRIISGPIRE